MFQWQRMLSSRNPGSRKVIKGVFTPIVCLLWSESVDEFVNLECFPLVRFLFTQKNPSHPKCITTNHVRTFSPLIGQMCPGWEQESKYRTKVVCSGLVHISVQLNMEQWLAATTRNSLRVLPHAKHTWLQEPFSSNLQSTPGSCHHK